MDSYQCKNCKLEFEANEAAQCPRCSSAQIHRKPKDAPLSSAASSTVAPAAQPRKFVYGPVITDTKESWKNYHNADVQVCSACGGKDFEFIWKRKEKVCKKCGEIMPLRRR